MNSRQYIHSFPQLLHNLPRPSLLHMLIKHPFPIPIQDPSTHHISFNLRLKWRKLQYLILRIFQLRKSRRRYPTVIVILYKVSSILSELFLLRQVLIFWFSPNLLLLFRLSASPTHNRRYQDDCQLLLDAFTLLLNKFYYLIYFLWCAKIKVKNSYITGKYCIIDLLLFVFGNHFMKTLGGLGVFVFG